MRDVAHQAADSRSKRDRNLCQWHARSDAKGEGRDGESKGGMEANACDQEQQKQDGSRGTGEQEPAGGDRERRSARTDYSIFRLRSGGGR